MELLPIILTVLVLAIIYLWHVQRALNSVPTDAEPFLSPPWTTEMINEAYDSPDVDYVSSLPPKLERRYVVVGGSGLVGGAIVKHLIARGQPPNSIRSLDLRTPHRPSLCTGPAAEIDFHSTDVTDAASVTTAFDAPWPEEHAGKPLTVFHTAAIVDAATRLKRYYGRVEAVNVKGTQNVMAAAKEAGADVFIITSSGSVGFRRVNIWIWPWQWFPKGMSQVYPDPVLQHTTKGHFDYFGNYAVSKARSEGLVLRANESGFRTGAIRPCCGIYGDVDDFNVGAYIRMKTVPTWVSHVATSFVSAENVSLGHLLDEAAILSHPDKVSGHAFNVTDPGLAPRFSDMYRLVMDKTLSGVHVVPIPVLMMVFIAYCVEAYSIVYSWGLQNILPSLPTGMQSIGQVQPGLIGLVAAFQFARNDHASKPPAEGGIGYKGCGSTIQGMAQELRDWNSEWLKSEAERIGKEKKAAQ